MMSLRGIRSTRGKPRCYVTFSTRNHTWSSPGLNWDPFCDKLAINRLNHGTSNTHYS